jgi:biopolymer transport protein ExbD
MRFQKTTQPSQEFQLAPMVDILFILLLFFIVTTSYQAIEKELSIALPDADNAVEVDQAGRDVIVNITDRGTYVINRKEYTLVELRDVLFRTKKMLGTTTILLRADKRTLYQDIVSVMDLCSELKITRLSFITQAAEK